MTNLLVRGVCIAMCAPVFPVCAQDYESIQWTPVTDPAGFSYAVPSDWTREDAQGFTGVFIAPDRAAYCTLKRTADWSFEGMSAEEYVQLRVANPDEMENQLPLQYPDGSGKFLGIKEFPFGLEAGIVITSSGNMFGENIVASVFQTVQLGAVFTLACFALPEHFGYYFPVFTGIVGEFEFSR